MNSKTYAVVDLEATSAGSDAKIIQVGIVLVRDGQIIRTYETDVNPHEPLTQHIKNLTGMTDERLAEAPDFSQVAREIYAHLEGAVFVAHNVRFDGNLLAEMLFLEGYDLRTDRVDTVELSQVFFPTLEKYNLAYLADVLDLELEEAHTALADAKATAQLFLKLQERILTLPKITVGKILELADHLIYETGQLIAAAYQQMTVLPLTSWHKVQDLVLAPVLIYNESYQLSKDFEHNLALMGLDGRPPQNEFAALITDHLTDHQVNFIQAQAGIGKTYGYLLSLLAHAQGRRIIVATPTKILQDQIMQSEAQAISEVFHINFHSLKGYDNYIKLDTFWETLARETDSRLVNRWKMAILVWLTETTSGDLDEIKQKQLNHPYFEELRHDGRLSRSSFFREEDFWLRNRRKSKVSQVIITNQAYLLTRLEDDPGFVEGAVLVIDEAQKLFLSLEQLSRRSQKITVLLEQIRNLHGQSANLLTRRILESLEFKIETLNSSAQPASLTKEQIRDIRQDLKELTSVPLPQLSELFAPGYEAFWLTQENAASERENWLHAGKLNFLHFADLLPESVKVFCISASLFISRKADLPQLLGFLPEQITFDVLEEVTTSNQTVWLPSDLPAVADLTEADYADFLTEKIKILSRLNLPLLILFNANQLLCSVSKKLTQAELPHLAQHLHGTASNIKRRFERGEHQILLGSGAFWEGVDFSNQPEILLVLTRLPFDSPSDQFVQKVNRRLKEEGKNPFYDYQLPLTILKIQQAIGRTRRTQKQRSAVLILDNRILDKAYGKRIQHALRKNCQLKEVAFEDSVNGIEAYLK